jgi:hypothetical protein
MEAQLLESVAAYFSLWLQMDQQRQTKAGDLITASVVQD